jgi:hypothetical protein
VAANINTLMNRVLDIVLCPCGEWGFRLDFVIRKPTENVLTAKCIVMDARDGNFGQMVNIAGTCHI